MTPPKSAVVGLALLASLGCGRPGFEVRPNVVLITVDTLRPDRIGSYGYAAARTPHIDRLAAEGAVFRSASTVIPRTSQSIASIFSSLYPHQHGSLEIGEGPRRDLRLAAQIFQDAGYATAGISGNGAASRTQGFERGFDHFVGWQDLSRKYQIWGDPPPPGPGPWLGRAEALTREALDWIGREHERPYFLWLLYMDPHWFYNPPPPYRDVIDWTGFTYYHDVRSWKPKNATIYFNLDGSSHEFQPRFSQLYDAELAYTDAALGPLFEELRQGERPTLIVFTADHGESLGEHGYYFEHGDFVWETTMRVPLILHAPGVVPAAREVDVPASTLDILPTMLALIGLPAPEGARFAGDDLSGLLFNPADGPGDRLVFGESGSALIPQNPYREIGGTLMNRRVKRFVRDGRWLGLLDRELGFQLFDARSDPFLRNDVSASQPDAAEKMRALVEQASVFGSRWRTVRDARWKLIRIPGVRGIRDQLYDLHTDPGELRDLAAEHPEQRDRLAAALDTWLATIPPEAGGLEGERDPQAEEELEEQLRSLGYVD
jgi:arylsulfatase A-like enzyme